MNSKTSIKKTYYTLNKFFKASHRFIRTWLLILGSEATIFLLFGMTMAKQLDEAMESTQWKTVTVPIGTHFYENFLYSFFVGNLIMTVIFTLVFWLFDRYEEKLMETRRG